jgi:hypothetical protein
MRARIGKQNCSVKPACCLTAATGLVNVTGSRRAATSTATAPLSFLFGTLKRSLAQRAQAVEKHQCQLSLILDHFLVIPFIHFIWTPFWLLECGCKRERAMKQATLKSRVLAERVLALNDRRRRSDDDGSGEELLDEDDDDTGKLLARPQALISCSRAADRIYPSVEIW